MKMPTVLASLTCVLAVSAIASARSQLEIPTGPQLRAELLALQTERFRLLYEACDTPEKLADWDVPDAEYYHDETGMAKGARGDLRIKMQRDRCERQARTGHRIRHELVSETFVADPIPGFGALVAGEHRFFRTERGQPERLSMTARFATVLKRDRDGWKSYRVFNYAHRRYSRQGGQD